jgi:hypothetical protein
MTGSALDIATEGLLQDGNTPGCAPKVVVAVSKPVLQVNSDDALISVSASGPVISVQSPAPYQVNASSSTPVAEVLEEQKAHIVVGGNAASTGPADWNTLLNKPDEFPPEDHGHAITDISGLQAELNSKAEAIHAHDWTEIENKPVTFPPSNHTHTDYVNKTGDQMTGPLEVTAQNTGLKSVAIQDYKDAVQVIVNSEFSDDSLWTLSGGWSISGGKLRNTTGVTGNISIALTGLTAGASYVIDVGLDAGTVYFQPSSDAGVTKRSYWRSWEGPQFGFVAPSASFTLTLSQDYVLNTTVIDYIRMYRVVTNAQRVMQGASYSATTFDLVASGSSFGLGPYSLQNAGNAIGSVAIGDSALRTAIRPFNSIAIGTNSLRDAQGPAECVAIGRESLRRITTGSNSVCIGNESLQYVTVGGLNCVLGNLSLNGNTTGNGNCVVGYNSLNSVTTGYDNVTMGFACAYLLGTGSAQNVVIGARCLLSGTPSVISTFTALGYGAGNNAPFNGSTCLGAGSGVTGANQVQLGASGTTTYAYGAVQDRSDRRDKRAIRDTVLGLDFIMALRPVDFKWDMRDDYQTPIPATLQDELEAIKYELSHSDAPDALLLLREAEIKNLISQIIEGNKLDNITPTGAKVRSRYHHGLIAQEVRDVIQDTGIDFGGYQNHKLLGGQDVMSIGYTELIGPMIKAIQQQKAIIDALESRIAALEQQ